MGRVIVITGGTSGIGLGLKSMFENIGDTVLTFSLDETGDQNHYAGSVDHEIKVRQVFNDIHERYGTIDMLINCAGIGMSAITELASLEEIKKVMDVNFYGTLYCIRCAIPFMNAGARIVNLSSAMALFPVPFRSIYGAAKSAVLSLSQSLRMELAPLGIDVTAICPGDTKTNFTANRIKEFETSEKYGDRLKTATMDSDAEEDKRMTCEYVCEKIFKLINGNKTKPFYIIGGKYKFWYFLTRFTPKSALLNVIAKKKGGRMEELPQKKVKPPKEPKQKKEKENPVEEVLEETTTTPAVEPVSANTTENTETTQQQTEAPKKLDNLLSKISILNKPNEKKEDTTDSEVSDNNTNNETTKEEPSEENK